MAKMPKDIESMTFLLLYAQKLIIITRRGRLVTNIVAVSVQIAMKLADYRKEIDALLPNVLTEEVGVNQLALACRYALHGGKRIRPALCMSIARRVSDDAKCAVWGAIAVELVHTASLVIDDLPCMDNDDMRRGKNAVHKQFGEAVAQLTSTCLVSTAVSLFIHNADIAVPNDRERCNAIGMEMMRHIADKLGGLGAAGGQFLDLAMTSPNGGDLTPNLASIQMDELTLVDVIHKKTSTFFEVAFVVGWLLGGGDFKAIWKLQTAARHFGLAYQLADDLEDVQQDWQAQRKNACLNYVLRFGVNTAREKFDKSVVESSRLMNELGLITPLWDQLTQMLREKWKRNHFAADVFLTHIK